MEKLMNLKMRMAMELRYDDAPISPRDDCNFGAFYLWDSHVISPDDNDYRTATDFLTEMLGEVVISDIHNKSKSHKEFNELIFNACKESGYLVFPVGLERNSYNCYRMFGPDNMPGYNPDGYIFVTQHEAVGEDNPADSPLTDEIINQVKVWLQNEVSLYEKWANGHVYEVVLTSLLGDIVGSACNLYEDDQEFAFEAIRDLHNIGNDEDWEDYDSMAIANHFGMGPVA